MQTSDFVYQARAARVVFGAGSLQHLEREVHALGARRAIVLCTPEQRGTAETIASRLGAAFAGIFDGAVMHVPIETARQAREQARRLEADCAIAVGGGSTIGLGKAIALDSGLPILAIPTTYAGSEMTPIYGLTENGLKRTGTDLRVLPRTVIYDPELTLTLPVEMSITSAINALAHAAEGLYSRDSNPITSLIAEEAIAAIAQGLPGVHATAYWAPWAWPCTTSCAIRSVAASICLMRPPTPSCCRTHLPTTPRPRRRPWVASPGRSAQTTLRWASTNSRGGMVHQSRCATWE